MLMQGQREQRMDLCVSSLATTQAKKDPRGSLQSFVAACIMWTMGNADPAASHDIAGALTTGDVTHLVKPVIDHLW